MVSILIGSTSGLLDQRVDGGGGVLWLTVMGMVVSAYALATYLVLRWRRPARRAALAANR